VNRSLARAISRTAQNQGFTCENCGASVAPLSNGSYRNHCPACLLSKHVDILPGDRAYRIAEDPVQGDDIDAIIALMAGAGGRSRTG
jgi:hypothetical protein